MSIVLQSSGGGSVTINEPTTASNFTQTLPASNGTIVVSGTTPSLNGITFPATQSPSADANTLDDYEEGSWTPTLGRYISNPTVTYASVVGKYTKIGNVVYISCGINWTGNTGGSGDYYIGGLPFTASSGTASYTQCLINDINGITFPALRTYMSGEVSVSTTNMSLIATGSGVNTIAIITVANAGYIYCSGFYYVS